MHTRTLRLIVLGSVLVIGKASAARGADVFNACSNDTTGQLRAGSIVVNATAACKPGMETARTWNQQAPLAQLYQITSAVCAGTSNSTLVTTSSACVYTACSGNGSVAPACDSGCVQTGPVVIKQQCTPFGCTDVDQCAPCSCSNVSLGFTVMQ